MIGVLLVGAWTFHRDVGPATGQPSTTKSMVVAELFTSEGCSSCPPADVYTPQLVVDGRFERVGSDITAVQRAITQAAHAPKAAVDVAALRANDRDLRVDIHVTVPASLTLRESADVLSPSSRTTWRPRCVVAKTAGGP
jgi:hypothetical protein